jgi:hypothetical protein
MKTTTRAAKERKLSVDAALAPLLLLALLASARAEASLERASTPKLAPASASLSIERALTLEESAAPEPRFDLFEGDELARSANERPQNFHPLAALSLLDEHLPADLASTAEPSYPKTRVWVFDVFSQRVVGVSSGLSVELRWGSARFSAGLASDEREDPLGLCPTCGVAYLVQSGDPVITNTIRDANKAADEFFYHPLERAAGSIEGTGRFAVSIPVALGKGTVSVGGTMVGHAGSADKVVEAYQSTQKFLAHPVDNTIAHVKAAIDETQARIDARDHYGAGRVFTEEVTAPVATAVVSAPGAVRSLATGARALVQDLKSAHPTRGAVPAGGNRLRRPYVRKPVVDVVEARASRSTEGLPVDPNTKQPITTKPDLGHVYGREFRRLRAEAEAEGIPQSEFNERVQEPNLYQLEDPSSNRSRRFEKPGND